MRGLESLNEVFHKRIFRIPDYQRGYAWGQKQFVEFWEDLVSLDKDRSHYTGVLSIKRVPVDKNNNWNEESWLIEKREHTLFYVVDGQQRLTTVSIFLQCLIEVIQKLTKELVPHEKDIMLGSYRLTDIIEQYICVKEPKHEINKTYKFGYETDNPSFEFLRHRIFNEPNEGTINETFYTLNLENAKEFFKQNINQYAEDFGIDGVEDLFYKLTTKFLFNVYEIKDDFDVFVAFETMNNRGKQLSDLELLKNRLIYLTTLYKNSQVDESTKESIREKINNAWKEVYFQLGRNKKNPLNDDEFLRAHWIMYFKYSRVKGNDYIRYLLDDYFNPKNVLETINISTSSLEQVEELTDEEESDDESPTIEEEPQVEIVSKRTIKDIDNYVSSLKVASKTWYSTYFPQNSDALSEDEKIWMDKINRVKISYFRPLIMAALIKTDKGEPARLKLLKAIERFLFLVFRINRMQSNYRSSYYYRAARSVYFGEMNIDEVLAKLDKDLKKACYIDDHFDAKGFETFIDRKFKDGGDGFYGWNDLRYFLFEYEESLRESRGQPKLSWSNFTKSDKDKISIEHILPQTPTDPYWIELFEHFDDESLNSATGSLGNLLPLSSAINSSLQNDSFDNKKEAKYDSNQNLIRNGYNNGSNSELEVVNQYPTWDVYSIIRRGLKLLSFLENRWGVKFESKEQKLKLLHLESFGENVDDNGKLNNSL